MGWQHGKGRACMPGQALGMQLGGHLEACHRCGSVLFVEIADQIRYLYLHHMGISPFADITPPKSSSRFNVVKGSFVERKGLWSGPHCSGATLWCRTHDQEPDSSIALDGSYSVLLQLNWVSLLTTVARTQLQLQGQRGDSGLHPAHLELQLVAAVSWLETLKERQIEHSGVLLVQAYGAIQV